MALPVWNNKTTYPGVNVMRWMTATLGRPYQLAGEGPNFDCSGYPTVGWRDHSGLNITLPHQSGMQFVTCEPVWEHGEHYSLPGDLFFYYGPRGMDYDEVIAAAAAGKVMLPNHVAMFLGWYRGVPYVAQATQPGVLSEVIPMSKYVKAGPSSKGRPKFVGNKFSHGLTRWNGQLGAAAEFSWTTPKGAKR